MSHKRHGLSNDLKLYCLFNRLFGLATRQTFIFVLASDCVDCLSEQHDIQSKPERHATHVPLLSVISWFGFITNIIYMPIAALYCKTIDTTFPINSLRRSDAYIYISELTIIGSDNGLSPGRRQAIIWTNDGILLIRALGTNVKFTHLHSRKCIWKCCLRNGCNFFSASIY